tara:strand:+ start:17276 stop:18502 length:1227 start_codon:yes stop_codon:yes gene_type:complete
MLAIRILNTASRWKAFQLLTTAKVIVLSFLTVTLQTFGFTVKEALAVFAGMYFMSSILVKISKKQHLKNPVRLVRYGLIASSCFLMSFSLTYNLIPTASLLLLTIGVTIISVVCDLFGSESLISIQSAADRNNVDNVVLMTVGGFVTSIIIAVAFPVFGTIADISPLLYIFSISILMLCVLFFKAFSLKNYINKKPPIDKFTPPRGLFGMAVFFNSVSMVGRYFILPLYVADVALEYGLTGNVMRLIGIVLGVIALVAIVSRVSIKDINLPAQASMNVGFTVGVFSWVGIVIASLSKNTISNLLISVLLIVIFEITVKFWTAGYFGLLRKFADEDEIGSSSEVRYSSYFASHLGTIKVCSGISFLLMYLLYDSIEPGKLVIISGFIAILYMLIYNSALRKFAAEKKPA